MIATLHFDIIHVLFKTDDNFTMGAIIFRYIPVNECVQIDIFYGYVVCDN